MHNIHTHVWDQARHFDPATVRETDLSRGRPLDLTVRFDAFMADMAPFDRVIVFGLKARLTGYWVPDAYVADFVARAPEKLIGFAAVDPTQPEMMEELRYGIERLGLRGVKMGPVYAGIDPRDPRCDAVYAYCQTRQLPLIVHAGTTFNRLAPLAVTRPWLFDDVAIRYPALKLVLAHLGHPWTEECCAVIRKHPNLYADIAALYYRPWQFYNALLAAQEYRVTPKLLFGTDYPFATAAESIAGLRTADRLTAGTALPRLDPAALEDLLARDAVGRLLGEPRA